MHVYTQSHSHTHTELKKKTHDSITTNKQMNQSKIELKTWTDTYIDTHTIHTYILYMGYIYTFMTYNSYISDI